MTDVPYAFAPHERPAFPGSPYTPTHAPVRRAGYAAVALAAGIGATLGNGLVNVNAANIAGNLGLYAFEAALLPAVYVAFNASANLMLVKGRAQFGIPAVTQGLLAVYAIAALLQWLVPGLATAVVARAACGMAAGALVTYSIYCWMQVLPAKARPLALVFGICVPQLGLPLARLFPVETLGVAGWHALHLVELGTALALFAASAALPLPPSERSRALEPLDFATFVLVLAGMLLVCLVLAEGRLLWWTDTPWLGATLAAAVAPFCVAFSIERLRRRPLLQLGWLGSTGILRFAAVALIVRLALAEQTYGAVGLLTSGGLTNDQLRTLFALVALAMALGTLSAAALLAERRLPWLVVAAALVIAAGAWTDAGATNLARPPQLYASQMLIAFGTTLFVGPALLYGFLQMFQKGADHLVSFVVLFSVTQNVGGLLGSALLGSYQVIRTRAHAVALSTHLVAADPQVATRVQAQGSGPLTTAMNREAGVLAYNDVFVLVACIALATAGYVSFLMIRQAVRARCEAVA